MQVKRHCAVKYRMYPNRAQAALIDRTIGCARFIYNQMLGRPADAGRSVFVPATRRPSTTPIVSAKMETPAEALLTSPLRSGGHA